MPSTLIRDLIEKQAIPVVDDQALEDFVHGQKHSLLFFTENPQQFPESNDVAVVVPLLMAQFGDRFRLAVVDRQSERRLHARFPFESWPALVMLRDGDYVGAICRMQDWDVYLKEIERLLNTRPLPAPGIGIPVVGAPGHCH
jgi:hydrogenase-1 operon protein HyaE